MSIVKDLKKKDSRNWNGGTQYGTLLELFSLVGIEFEN